MLDAIASAAIKGERLSPEITASKNYKHWISIEDTKRCFYCGDSHGKIWLIDETPSPKPPVHFGCRCRIELMMAIKAGTATINGIHGADWNLKYKGELPNYYISKEQLKTFGWKRGKAPSSFAKGKMLTKGVFRNEKGHLPQVPGRVWYEADINYKSGKRNSQRVLWSNDGLIFVTYDHYETFYELI